MGTHTFFVGVPGYPKRRRSHSAAETRGVQESAKAGEVFWTVEAESGEAQESQAGTRLVGSGSRVRQREHNKRRRQWPMGSERDWSRRRQAAVKAPSVTSIYKESPLVGRHQRHK